jgi:hypothetical protein
LLLAISTKFFKRRNVEPQTEALFTFKHGGRTDLYGRHFNPTTRTLATRGVCDFRDHRSRAAALAMFAANEHHGEA